MNVQTIRAESEGELVVLSRADYEALRAGREPGPDTVVLSRREFDSLRARAGDGQAEDAMADRIVREARLRRDKEGDEVLPSWLSGAILAGQHPVTAARERSRLTLVDLAAQTGISEARLTEIEQGRAGLLGPELETVATALDVKPSWIED